MDRLDARTASFFAIGLLCLSFGCKSGAALHALGAGAVTAAKVATVVAAAAATSPGRGRVVEEGASPAPATANCPVVCPDEGDGLVCATPVVVVDTRTDQNRVVYECGHATFR
jgi:hypothetical protein